MMTEVEAIELVGGPLDGLELVIPAPRATVRFPVIASPESFCAPIDPDAVVTTSELIYWRSPDKPHRYVWQYR